MRFIYFIAVLVVVAVFGCSDGKLNLLLVLWNDSDNEPSSASFEEPSSSSIAIPPSSAFSPSSSSNAEIPLSSSIEEEPPPSSSSGRGQRYSSAKVKDGYEVPVYPPLEEGALGVEKANPGGLTRYWDGCKGSCSFVYNTVQQDNVTRSPHGFAKNCDINGKEMPLFYRQDNAQTHAEFIFTPNACQPHNMQEWMRSTTYAEWTSANPDFPTYAPGAYLCADDQMPYAVNDNLAYAFAANSTGNCGKCFQIQFDSDWNYGAPRPPHRAIAGKTLIVMVSNFGVKDDAFDIMIPGGGMGDFQILLETLDLPRDKVGDWTILGRERGGLLDECTFAPMDPNRSFAEIGVGLVGDGGIERRSHEEVKECLTAKCNRAFKNHPTYLKGCLWHVDWFEAVDNPEGIYKEVPCPQYLIDRYTSSFSLPKRPADLNPGANCGVGELKCEEP